MAAIDDQSAVVPAHERSPSPAAPVSGPRTWGRRASSGPAGRSTSIPRRSARHPPHAPLRVDGVILLESGARTGQVAPAGAGDAALALASACFNLREHAEQGLTLLRDLVLGAPTWHLRVDGVAAAADAADHLARTPAA